MLHYLGVKRRSLRCPRCCTLLMLRLHIPLLLGSAAAAVKQGVHDSCRQATKQWVKRSQSSAL